MNDMKRKPRIPNRARITPAAVEAFKAGDVAGLRKALQLRPWETSPLDAVGACPWPPSTAGGRTWAKALELREELQCAA